MSQIEVGILGAGTMGRQLALLFAANHVSVRIWNHRYQDNFQSELDQLILVHSKLGHITKDAMTEVAGRIHYTNDLAALSGCELIVETVKEDRGVKVATFKQLARVVSDYKILATNTSSLSISDLAPASGRSSQFIGLHFFNPAMSIKLVEVIKGERTSEDTLLFALKILKQIGKQSVVLPEIPGSVVDRLLFPMINEAVSLLSESAVDAKTIDRCMRLGVRHPMGPLELADLIGLDVCFSILETLAEAMGDARYRPVPLLKKYVSEGRLGRKTGCGFYNYNKS